ncbi:hypothetical protein EGR_10543 [Echinococcus granulosus]|uniref:Uncharacterized protein n=1 Tax=Echinococcus granulosus TaxID=6210 RepID=W6U0G7_ECHGR|nr:hypothetical protein EGR_10543 [Echinococcus granulosus]EUB54605.1 hypothetical protein EGR_10543 [Echinococcus granulosus]
MSGQKVIKARRSTDFDQAKRTAMRTALEEVPSRCTIALTSLAVIKKAISLTSTLPIGYLISVTNNL